MICVCLHTEKAISNASIDWQAFISSVLEAICAGGTMTLQQQSDKFVPVWRRQAGERQKTMLAF